MLSVGKNKKTYDEDVLFQSYDPSVLTKDKVAQTLELSRMRFWLEGIDRWELFLGGVFY